MLIIHPQTNRHDPNVCIHINQQLLFILTTLLMGPAQACIKYSVAHRLHCYLQV